MEIQADNRELSVEDDGILEVSNPVPKAKSSKEDSSVGDDSKTKESLEEKGTTENGTDSLKDKTLSIPRDKEPATSEISPDSPTCRVGDLVWASVSGKASSWWPAMVTYDPDQAVYFRFKNGKRLEYHVQWFGKGALRSWVQASRMKRFTSLDQYDISKHKSGLIAMAEVKDAVAKPLRERKCSFIFNFGISNPLPSLPTKKKSGDGGRLPQLASSGVQSQDVKRIKPSKTKSRSKSSSSSRSDVSEVAELSLVLPAAEEQPMEVDELEDGGKQPTLSITHSGSSDSLPLSVHLPTPPDSSPPTLSDCDMCANGDSVLFIDARKRPTPPPLEDFTDLKRVCPSGAQSQSSTDEESLSLSKDKGFPPLLQSGQCSICLGSGNKLISCSQCNQMSHHDCLGLRRLPSPPFVCDECVVAGLTCFFCKSSDGDLTSCSYYNCTRQYHRECIQDKDGFKFSSHSFYCPLHCCIRCARSSDKSNPPRAPLVSCSQCLLTLHNHSQCLIAGCEVKGGKSMLCYQHVPTRTGASHKKRPVPSSINLDWCYMCGNGGTLVCCDVCSSAFHKECIAQHQLVTNVPDTMPDSWVCPDCSQYQMLTYGSLAWCKCGNHRFWPCEVVPPKQVPEHLLRLKPVPCMFLVRFFGTNEHCWTHHGRCVPYHMDTDGRPRVFDSTGSSKKVAALKNALLEIAERAKSKSLSQKTSKKHRKLKTNRYLVSPPPCDMMFEMCNCSEASPCIDDSKCVNRAVKIECSSSSCRLGEVCQNRRMQKLEKVSTVPFYTGSRGWGLKATQDIKSGEFVVEYVGEVIDDEMCRDRLKKYREDGKQCFYILSLDRGLYIDAAVRANEARFINHSCQPNLETQKWIVDKRTRIGLFAVHDIISGEELTFDYQLDTLGHVKMKCFCGAPNCSGYLGEKAKSISNTKKTVKKKNSTKRS